MKPSDRVTLECMIDSTSLEEVLRVLAEICHEKADHVESTWQDRELARTWTKAGKYIDYCANRDVVNQAGR